MAMVSPMFHHRLWTFCFIAVIIGLISIVISLSLGDATKPHEKKHSTKQQDTDQQGVDTGYAHVRPTDSNNHGHLTPNSASPDTEVDKIPADQHEDIGRAWVLPPANSQAPWTGGAPAPRIGKPTAPIDLNWSWTTQLGHSGQLSVRLTSLSDGQECGLTLHPGLGVTLSGKNVIAFKPVKSGESYVHTTDIQLTTGQPWITLVYHLDHKARSVRIPLGWNGYTQNNGDFLSPQEVDSLDIIRPNDQEILMPAQ